MSPQEILQDYFRPYQRAFLADPAPRRAVVKARQIGMTETIAVDGLLQSQRHTQHDVHFVSTNFRNAKDVLRRCLKWVKVFQAAGVPIDVTKRSASIVEFSNGSRLLALPCKPESIRSKTGSFYLDEAAFYPHEEELWKAVDPATRARKINRLAIVSTPFGPGNLFAEIFNDTSGQHEAFSRHKVDVYDAYAQGFPIDPEEIREQYTEDAFTQEFLCGFLAGGDSFFSPPLLRSCLTDAQENPLTGSLILGVDVGATSDRTVITFLYDTGSRVQLHSFESLSKMTQDEQKAHIDALIEAHRPSRVVIDRTGLGRGLYDFLRAEHGPLIKGQDSTRQYYERYIKRLRLMMERGLVELDNDSSLRRDFLKIKAHVSPANNLLFKAKRTAKEGHADIFYSALLAFSVSSLASLSSSQKQPVTAVSTSIPSLINLPSQW